MNYLQHHLNYYFKCNGGINPRTGKPRRCGRVCDVNIYIVVRSVNDAETTDFPSVIIIDKNNNDVEFTLNPKYDVLRARNDEVTYISKKYNIEVRTCHSQQINRNSENMSKL